jgi:hypothetical protein
VERVQDVNITAAVNDDHVVLAEGDEFWMGSLVLPPVRGSERKWTKASGQTLSDFFHIHASCLALAALQVNSGTHSCAKA